MIVTRDIASTRDALSAARRDGRRFGLVPTMGAMHAGHRSLIDRAVDDCGYVVVTIFVNPTQFGPGEDFTTYPRTTEADLNSCRQAGVALVFMPTADEMYPADAATAIHVDGLTQNLCGPHRPGHFDGVATIVAKLFQIVMPDAAYFGRKDAQQLAMIERMTADLNMPIEVIGCATVREADGLAMSSRNTRLIGEDRTRAGAIFRALTAAADAIGNGIVDVEALEDRMRRELQQAGVTKIDYAEVVDARSLRRIDRVDRPVLLAIAVRIGGTRLIDNLEVDPSRPDG
jgi:pantoate--beta-alanine ligase